MESLGKKFIKNKQMQRRDNLISDQMLERKDHVDNCIWRADKSAFKRAFNLLRIYIYDQVYTQVGDQVQKQVTLNLFKRG